MAAASRRAGSRPASAKPASRASWSSASRTRPASRPRVATMSAWIAGSSAPGTSNSRLAGMKSAAMARKSSRCAGVRRVLSGVMAASKFSRHSRFRAAKAGIRGGESATVAPGPPLSWGDDILMTASFHVGASVEQVGETLLHLIGDIERQRLDGGGRVHAAGGDEEASVDDEQVFHVVRTPPLVHDRAIRVGAHPGGAEKVPAAIKDRAVDADVSRLRRGEDFLRTGDTVIHHPR